jgi:hypothetical protein
MAEPLNRPMTESDQLLCVRLEMGLNTWETSPSKSIPTTFFLPTIRQSLWHLENKSR